MTIRGQHFDSAAIQLPIQPTPLIGRKREVDELSQLMKSQRLVTLLGPSGTGKTRLAVEVALRCAEHYPDGVAFVGLAPVEDPTLLLSSIATALDIREQGNEELLDTLRRELRQRQQLLVIDNFEQLSDASHILGTLVRDVPGLALLVTSQVALHQPTERVYPVPPLDYSAAVELFVTRAQVVCPDFDPDAADAAAIERIYTLVHGLPLGLELAAAQADRHAVPEIAEIIERTLTAPQAEAERHLLPQTLMLRRLLDWSYQQLPDTERRLFVRMGVFSGGCALQALESVCADVELDLLDSTAYLLDRNLIIQQEIADELRWTMLDVITEYARELLAESGEEQEIRNRHAAYYHALAEEAAPELRGPHSAVWFGRLEAVHHNLRAALTWLMAEQRKEEALLLTVLLGRFWWARGYLTEGLTWLTTARALPVEVDQAIELRGMMSEGFLRGVKGDLPGARALLEQAGELSLQLGDLPQAARAFSNVGALSTAHGDGVYAVKMLERALAIHEELTPGGPATAHPLSSLGLAALITGDYEGAGTRFAQALVIFEQMNDLDGHTTVLSGQGWLALELGRHAEAQRHFALAQRLGQQMGHHEHTADMLWSYAAAVAPRDPKLAALLGGAGEALFATLGVQMFQVYVNRLNTARAAAQAEHEGQPGWQRWQEGQALDHTTAVEMMLDDAIANGALEPAS